jgi:hypothetical protein
MVQRKLKERLTFVYPAAGDFGSLPSKSQKAVAFRKRC